MFFSELPLTKRVDFCVSYRNTIALSVDFFFLFQDGVILPEVQCGLYTAIVPVEPGAGNLGIRPQFVNVTRCQGSCAHSPGIRECEPTKYRTIPVRVTSSAGGKTSIRDVQEHSECRCACLVTCNFLVQYVDENDCRCVCIKKCKKDEKQDPATCKCTRLVGNQ